MKLLCLIPRHTHRPLHICAKPQSVQHQELAPVSTADCGEDGSMLIHRLERTPPRAGSVECGGGRGASGHAQIYSISFGTENCSENTRLVL